MKLLRKWWNLLGQVLGEGEYLRYCEHLSKASGAECSRRPRNSM